MKSFDVDDVLREIGRQYPGLSPDIPDYVIGDIALGIVDDCDTWDEAVLAVENAFKEVDYE